MNMLLGGVLGVLSAVAGAICLLMAVVMLAVHPWMLLWMVPLGVVLWWWGRRAYRRRARKPFDLERSWRSLYPPGYVPPHRLLGQQTHEPHLVEPITMGGHIRHTHHGHTDGEQRDV